MKMGFYGVGMVYPIARLYPVATPLLQDCILGTQMSTADPEHWRCNHNYMCNKYICSLIRPPYIYTHIAHAYSVQMFLCIGGWRFGNRL